jgi:hypothetical protein
MSDGDERSGTVIELLLREPEIVAWLEPLESSRWGQTDEDDDYEPPRAA